VTPARRPLVAAASLAAAAGAALAGWAVFGGDNTASATTPRPAATASVERRNLVVSETLDGELGFDDSRRAVAQLPGTVTRIAREGSTVRRGRPLYSINGRSTYVFYGSVPAWRVLRRGMSGVDVEQLERNLVALGYDRSGAIEIDGKFDGATGAAVKRWQDARGVAQDGVVELGDVVFLPGPRRVGQHLASDGAVVQPGAEIVETTSLRKLVTVELEASRQNLVREGDAVQVVLPDGRSFAGRVAQVGRVAERRASATGEEEGEPYVTVKIALPATVRGFDRAPVEVRVSTQTKANVLAVPVEALLALAGGGYAIEIVSANETRLVRVDIGAFADGYVEIAGAGVREGTRVVVPR
jgi:peptidoglycan hydrolase-like protein with peptidoglycan-binding domain